MLLRIWHDFFWQNQGNFIELEVHRDNAVGGYEQLSLEINSECYESMEERDEVFDEVK